MKLSSLLFLSLNLLPCLKMTTQYWTKIIYQDAHWHCVSEDFLFNHPVLTLQQSPLFFVFALCLLHRDALSIQCLSKYIYDIQICKKKKNHIGIQKPVLGPFYELFISYCRLPFDNGRGWIKQHGKLIKRIDYLTVFSTDHL